MLGLPSWSKAWLRPMSRLSKRMTRKPWATSCSTRPSGQAMSCMPRPMIISSGSPWSGPCTSTSRRTPLQESCISRAGRATRGAGVGPSCEVGLALDDARHQAVVDGLGGAHPVVALDVGGHALQRLAGGVGDRAGDALAGADDLAGLDGDVARLAAGAAGRLVDHEARVGQRQPALLGRGQVDVGAGAGHPTRADGGNRRAHEADHVVDGVATLDMAAGAGDQQRDRRIGLLRQREQAAAGGMGHLVVDLAKDHHVAALEEQLLLVFVGGVLLGGLVFGGEGVVLHGQVRLKPQPYRENAKPTRSGAAPCAWHGLRPRRAGATTARLPRRTA
mmetsp:Transcript_54683/g.129229  ORF Transcript_54683/g.129229 Transcript_54683/m.129229 type:complete len:333 (+) Transcript_54683:271-1269(+)